MPHRRLLPTLVATLSLTCANALPQQPASSETGASPPAPVVPVVEDTTLPLRDTGIAGRDVAMVTRVFRPPGPGPFPVVVFSHGRAPDSFARRRLRQGVSDAQVRFWLAHGAAVVSPIRPGYGATGGADREDSGARWPVGSTACQGLPNYAGTAAAAARSVRAAVAWLAGQPWADTRRVLLVGQSMGGLASVAAGADAPAGVVGLINFAGGTGGQPQLSPGRSCQPERLTQVYADLGRATTVPSLWMYAENDQYFGRDAPVAWHEAFAQGGSPHTFIHAPPVADGDGHGLSRHSPSLWARNVDAWLAGIPFLVSGAEQTTSMRP